MPKRPTERTRPRIGDAIEVETPRGLAYAQYTHEHRERPGYGSLSRVLPGLFAERPARFDQLVTEEERFSVFFPLGAATNRRIVCIVANEPIPEAKRRFPIFRSRIISKGLLGHGGSRMVFDSGPRGPGTTKARRSAGLRVTQQRRLSLGGWYSSGCLTQRSGRLPPSPPDGRSLRHRITLNFVRKTPRVVRTLRQADGIASGYGDDFIGTEHLLLALARDPEGIAGQVLQNLGVRADVERELRTILESPAYNPSGRAALRE